MKSLNKKSVMCMLVGALGYYILTIGFYASAEIAIAAAAPKPVVCVGGSACNNNGTNTNCKNGGLTCERSEGSVL